MDTIKILPVYSRRSQSDPIADIPTGLSLREHQVKTFEAIRDPDIDVIFNTAMTGDGKSLSRLSSGIDRRQVNLGNVSNQRINQGPRTTSARLLSAVCAAYCLR